MPGKPLTAIRVLDLSQALAGPIATMMLADAGAEVIKVEPPGIGDHVRKWFPPGSGGISPHFETANRNKQSLTLDLKKARGREVFLTLAKQADVVVENFRPGVVTRLGVDYEAVRQVNPRIIYCSVSGYGQTGPYRDRGAYDPIIQGEGGAMSVTGEVGGRPLKPGIAQGDIMAAQVAAFSITASLVPPPDQRGVYLDIGMLDVQISAMGFHLINHLLTGNVPKPMGTAHPLLAPSESFRTATLEILVATGNEHQWQQFCAVLGLEQLASDPRYAANDLRVGRRGEWVPIVETALAAHPAEFWIDKFTERNIPCGAVNTVDRLMQHPQVRARQMLMEIPGSDGRVRTMAGVPWRVSGALEGPHTPPPALGEHTSQVLSRMGFSEEEIAALRSEGVV